MESRKRLIDNNWLKMTICSNIPPEKNTLDSFNNIASRKQWKFVSRKGTIRDRWTVLVRKIKDNIEARGKN